MLKEYFIICRTVADIPEDTNPIEPILENFLKDITSMPADQLGKYLNSIFNVIEGDPIEFYDEEDEV